MSRDPVVVGSPPRGAPAAPAKPRHYPLAAFPATFVDELERYLQGLADPHGGQDRVYQQSTLIQRRNELRLAASALAEEWGDPARVTGLSLLVEPANT